MANSSGRQSQNRLLGLAASTAEAQNRYAAIAYSKSTGAYGYGNGYPTKEAALARARQECGRSDAKAFRARNSWIALAVSKTGGFGWTQAPTAAAARAGAIRQCRLHSPDARVVVCVSAFR
ncbi:MAG: DUF4189 domain-containing protein [Chthoniobacterales bacterium]|nr:DUF4189 domain-containing protein [Chthoniobacterales bacterium]